MLGSIIPLEFSILVGHGIGDVKPSRVHLLRPIAIRFLKIGKNPCFKGLGAPVLDHGMTCRRGEVVPVPKELS